MVEEQEEIIVGILGQWACGKSTAVKTLVNYLGGDDAVIFINDRALLAEQAVKHILESEPNQLKITMDTDGHKRYEGEHATVYLNPGEDFQSVDLNVVLFDLNEKWEEHDLPTWCRWFYAVRDELGHQICEKSGEGKPIVVEAGFGTNTMPQGENPFCHTIEDLFVRLQGKGVEPDRMKWIIIEASYETRSERNRKRADTVPAVEFERFAADGGDLDPDEQAWWEAKGSVIKRVSNEHDDVKKYRADIIAAFEELFEGRQVGARKQDYRVV